MTIEPFPGATEEDIRVFLLDSVMACAVQQRGIAVFHASAAEIGGRAVLFCGFSGAGKTAIALELYDRGLRLLADDSCAVSLDRTGAAVALPGVPQLGVWHDGLTAAQKDTAAYRPIRKGLKKYAFPVADRFCRQPVPLAHIFFLKSSNRASVEIHTVSGANKLKEMYQYGRNISLTEGTPAKIEHFKNWAVAGGQAKLAACRINTEALPVGETVDCLFEEMARRG